MVCVVDEWSADVAVQLRHRKVSTLSVQVGVVSRRAFAVARKQRTESLFSKSSRYGCPTSRGVRARRKGRRDDKRKISLENFSLCSSPRRDLAIPRGRVAWGGYLRKLSFPPPRPLSKSKSTPPLRFRGKTITDMYVPLKEDPS